MSIRVRRINGRLVALCAARSMPKEGDLYLDDGVHYALALKFASDWKTGANDPDDEALREVEESNNPNREEWDLTFGMGRVFLTDPRPSDTESQQEP